MKMKTILMAGTMLVSSLAQATPAKRPDRLPSDVCFETLRTLETPTTEDNLTPYDPFTAVDDQLYLDDSAYPVPEPTTMAMVTIILQELGKVIGNKIYQEIFRDGSKTTLTKADFKRIKEIVKEALREEAKDDLNECMINLQETHKFLSSAWDHAIAIDTYTTSHAVVTAIVNFDHLWSRLGMMQSAFFITSLNMGLTQELLKRDASKTDAFFEGTRSRATKSILGGVRKHEHLLDAKDLWVKNISASGKVCGKEKEHFCISVTGTYWGKRYYHHSEKCPAYDEGQEYCDERFERFKNEARDVFAKEYEKMNDAVYGYKVPDPGFDREYIRAIGGLYDLPAREPAQ